MWAIWTCLAVEWATRQLVEVGNIPVGIWNARVSSTQHSQRKDAKEHDDEINADADVHGSEDLVHNRGEDDQDQNAESDEDAHGLRAPEMVPASTWCDWRRGCLTALKGLRHQRFCGHKSCGPMCRSRWPRRLAPLRARIAHGRLLVVDRHQPESVAGMRGPVVLGTKPDVARLVLFLVVVAERLAP
jgi:hypothetical protein